MRASTAQPENRAIRIVGCATILCGANGDSEAVGIALSIMPASTIRPSFRVNAAWIRGAGNRSPGDPTPADLRGVICKLAAGYGVAARRCWSALGLTLRSKRILNHRRLISLSMGTQPNDAEKARRALRQRQPLLAAWLDALNRFDNPMRHRAANFREHSRLRRDIDPIRGLRMRDVSSDLAGPPPSPPASG